MEHIFNLLTTLHTSANFQTNRFIETITSAIFLNKIKLYLVKGLTSNSRQNKRCILKINGEDGEATLRTSFTERFRSEGGGNQGNSKIERKERDQRKKKEEKGLGLNRYRDKAACRCDALLKSGWIHRTPPYLVPFYSPRVLG
jgi:hypothetical protein